MLNIQEIQRQLKTKRIGRQVYYYDEVDSTNRIGHQLARTGAPDGSLLITEFQTAGKGRLGRCWLAAKSENVLMSLVLRPSIDTKRVHLITFLSSIVIIRSMQSLLRQINLPSVNFRVKWPNDILVNGKKIAGILSECKSHGKNVDYIVIGIGINLNQIFQERENDLWKTATSLRMVSTHRINREMFLTILLTQYEEYYLRVASENYTTVLQDWKEFWDGKNRHVMIGNHGLHHRSQTTHSPTSGGQFLSSDPNRCLPEKEFSPTQTATQTDLGHLGGQTSCSSAVSLASVPTTRGSYPAQSCSL